MGQDHPDINENVHLYVATMNRLVIEREEAYLEKKFGERYAGYRSRVRRWV